MRHSSALGRRPRPAIFHFSDPDHIAFVVTGLAALSCSPSPDGSMPDRERSVRTARPPGTMVGSCLRPPGSDLDGTDDGKTAPGSGATDSRCAGNQIYAAKNEFEPFPDRGPRRCSQKRHAEHAGVRSQALRPAEPPSIESSCGASTT